MSTKKFILIAGGLLAINAFAFFWANKNETLGNQANVRGREVEIIVDDFSGGITDNKNTNDYRFSQMLKNFEVRGGQLIPHRNSETGDNQSTTVNVRHIRAFTFARDALWGAGVPQGQTANGGVALYRKTFAQLDDGTWTNPPNAASSTSVSRTPDLFVYYKNFLYGAQIGTTGFWRYDAVNASLTTSWQLVTFADVAQGIVHSKDDNLYIPYDNKIAKFDGDTNEWIPEALILPTDKQINTITEYGNYLAIGASTITEEVLGVASSVVYLWDRNTALTTVSENINWESGVLEILTELDGFLIGISYSPTQASGGDTSSFNAKIDIRVFDGNRVSKIFELISDVPLSNDESPGLRNGITKHRGALYFPIRITLDGVIHSGIWKLYRPSPQAGFTLTLDRTFDNNTIATSTLSNGVPIYNSTIYDVEFWDDFMFIAYIDESNGRSYISKTNDLPSYTASSTIETVFFGDGIHKNILKSIGIMTEPMPQGGQIDFLYKMDGDRAWTLATTSTNVGSMFTEIISNERDGVLFPQFTKAKFRFDSIGNATTTGYRIKYEILDNVN